MLYIQISLMDYFEKECNLRSGSQHTIGFLTMVI